MSSNRSLAPSEALAQPVSAPADATEDYARSLEILTAAERARAENPSPEIEHAVLTASEYVLACRVQAARAILAAGDRLPAEVLSRVRVDEQLVAADARAWLEAHEGRT